MGSSEKKRGPKYKIKKKRKKREKTPQKRKKVFPQRREKKSGNPTRKKKSTPPPKKSKKKHTKKLPKKMMRFGRESDTTDDLTFQDPFMTTDIDAMSSSLFDRKGAFAQDPFAQDPFSTETDSSSAIFERMVGGAADKSKSKSKSLTAALDRVEQLSRAHAVTDGQRARIEVALHETRHKKHGDLVAAVLAAHPRGPSETVEAGVREIMRTVAKISSLSRYEAEQSTEDTEDAADKDICARIPTSERGKYPWCKQQPDEISTEVMELIRLITKGKAQEVVDRALKQRGYSRYEIRKAAKQYATTMKRVLQTHRAFDSNVETTDASTVVEAVNELAQNPDFVQHMIELMAMHLPPDYPWRAESITTVCKWWIMQYLSMVRPQLVHAVISCPDKDPYKCTLLGLSLGGSEPIAKWHGSSSVHVPTHGTDESQVAVMLSNAKWADVFKKFEADKRALRGGKRRGAFAKLDASTKSKLNDAVKEVDAVFKQEVLRAIEALSIEVATVGKCIFDAWSGVKVPGTSFGSAFGSSTYESDSQTKESSSHDSSHDSSASSAYGSADELSSTYYGTNTRDSYDSESDYNSDSDSQSFGKDAGVRRLEINTKAKDAVKEVEKLLTAIGKATPPPPTITSNNRDLQDLKNAIDEIRVASEAVRPGGFTIVLGDNFTTDKTKTDAVEKALKKLMVTSNGYKFKPSKQLENKIKDIESDVYALHDTMTRSTMIDDATHLNAKLFTRKGVSSSALHDVVSKYTSLFLGSMDQGTLASIGIGATGDVSDADLLARVIKDADQKTMDKSEYREKARECAGYVTFRNKGAGAINARTLTLLLNGVYSADEDDKSLLSEENLSSGIIRHGVSLDGATISNGKNKTSLKKLVRPKFASQMQQYHENMLAAKSAISTWTVRLLGFGTTTKAGGGTGPVAYSVPRASAEHTAIAMNVLTQIAIKIAPAYAQSIQQFYETAGALSVNLTSSLVTTKSNTTPEEESLFDQRSADDESDTETGDISFFDDGY